MTVIWSERAVRHLEAIHGYIAQSSELYASSMIERLHARVGQLEAFPDSGRPVLEDCGEGAREVFEHPYRGVYEMRGLQVEVLAVVHMRQEQPGPLRAT